jgi:hypothetical protein
VTAFRARIDAALEEAESPPAGSGEAHADRPETHDINARPAMGRAGSDTATANGDVRLADPVTANSQIPRGALRRFEGAALTGELLDHRESLLSVIRRPNK